MARAAPDRRALLAGLSSTAALAACGIAPRQPNVKSLYRYTSEIDPALRRPIVTIPGTLGSRLRVGRDGPFIWGGPDRLSADPDDPESARRLALPIGDGKTPLSRQGDGIGTDGVLRRANARILFGALIEAEVYDGMIEALNAGGYQFSRSEQEEAARRGRNTGSLEFPYDWRRDIVEAARALDAFVERKALQIEAARRARYGRSIPAADMRFDFVAHSMGGLVLRYWLMFGGKDLPADGSTPAPDWAGARRAACAVFVAPPNLGSISAFESLVNGKSLGPLQPTYPPALVGTHPSTYQLMPRGRHRRVRLVNAHGPVVGDIYDAALWDRMGWGLLDPREDALLAILLPDMPDREARRARARAHLAQMLARAEQLQRALDQPGTPSGPDLFLVVGFGLDTPAGAAVDPVGGAARVVTLEEGDGVVLRASALSDDRQGGFRGIGPHRPIRYRTVLLLPGEHVAITRNPVFADNLLYWLLDAPRARAG